MSESDTAIPVVVGPREVIVEEESDNEDSTPATTSDEDKSELPRGEIPPEYWHVQKLVKYIKTGNQTATIVALCCLKDHNLQLDTNQMAIQDIGGLEIILNLLDTKDLRCKLAALMVICELSKNEEIRRCIADMGGIDVLLRNLSEPARDLQILVSETIFNVAELRKGRKRVRKGNGIPKLVDLLDIKEYCLNTPWDQLLNDEKEYVNVAKSAVRALWSVSRSLKNVHVMMKCGAVPLLARLLRSIHIEVIIPTIGTIARCAIYPSFQLAVETEGMIKYIAQHLPNPDNAELRRCCAEVIFNCSESAPTRDQVREAGALDPLIMMARDPKTRESKPLLCAVTGAIWKTAITSENVKRYDQLRTIPTLVTLLEDAEERSYVLENVVGALSECLKFEHNREILRRAGGIKYLVRLLHFTYPPLLVNVAKVLKECAKEDDSMRIIEDLDGVRFIWSLLKNASPKVQASAAWALVPCVANALDSGEMVRCFVGGLEIMVTLLKSSDNKVLSSICAAIAQVAQDTENLGIISDHGVVPLLVNLVNTEDEELREHLCSAIAYCSSWGSNCKWFGRLGAITPIVAYMGFRNANVHRTAALALYHLSKNVFNCITMHESGIVPFLMKTVSSRDKALQDASAGCLHNLRCLAFDAETYQLITRGKPKEEEDD